MTGRRISEKINRWELNLFKLVSHFVYVLKSLGDGNYYIGQTNDIIKRVNFHNKGKVLSTRLRRPFKLVGFKSFKDRNQARWFEYVVKKHGDRKKRFIIELEASGP